MLPGVVGVPLYKSSLDTLVDRQPRTLLAGPSSTGRWYDARCFPTPQGVTLLFQDVTEQHSAHEELRRREEASRRAQARAAVLADIAAAAAAGQTVEEVAEAALRGLALHLGLVAGNIHAVDEGNDRLRALALFGYDAQTATGLQSIPLDDTTAIGRLVRHGLPYLTHETPELPEASRRRIERAGLAASRWIALPIGAERIVATISLVFDDLRPFTGEDIAFDRAIADQLGLAMERAALHAQQDLQLSRLEAVMEASPVGLVYLDTELRVLLVNSAQERLMGHRREQLVGRPLADVYGDAIRPIYRDVLATGERRAYTEMHWRFADQPERGLTYWDIALTPVIDADGHVAGLVQSSDEVTGRVREARMRTALQETAQALTDTLEEEQVFVRLLGESASALEAESAVVCLLEGERLVMRYVYGLPVAVIGTALGPEDAPLLWEALRAEGPVAAEHSEWDLPAFSGGRVLHARSLLALPLLPVGAPSGVLVFAYHAAPRRFGDPELDFARNAATFAAQAVKNSRLYAEMRRARRFSEGLNEINSVVSSTMDVQTVLAQVLERAAAVVGADGMRLMILRFGQWESVESYETSAAPFLSRSASRVAEAARGHARPAVVLRRHAARQFRREMDRSGVGLVATVPLRQKGRVTGALLVGRATETPFSPDELGFLANVGAMLATALQNTRLFEQERHTARTLQESLLRTLPDIAGLAFASRTVTAYRPDLVGGDFSDAFELPDRRVGILIGDVQGKGIEAAGLTETVRASLRALLRAGFSPAQSLQAANGLLLDQQVDQFVTVFLLEYDQRAGTTRYSSAGHPAPLLVRGEAVDPLPTPAGAPLGTFPWTYEEGRLALTEGDTLVLYTDGLSEARRGGRFFGEQGLREALSGLHDHDPEAIVEALMGEIVAYADELRDDLHVLAVRLDAEQEAGDPGTGAG